MRAQQAFCARGLLTYLPILLARKAGATKTLRGAAEKYNACSLHAARTHLHAHWRIEEGRWCASTLQEQAAFFYIIIDFLPAIHNNAYACQYLLYIVIYIDIT